MAEIKRSLEMYGVVSIEEFVETLKAYTMFTDERLGGPAMVVMSMLSDAQEELERGMNDAARKTINRAKYIIANYLTPKEERMGI